MVSACCELSRLTVCGSHPVSQHLNARLTLAVGTFPDGKSALMLVTARLKCVAESEWGSRHYLHMTMLDEKPHGAGLWGCRKVRKNLDSTPNENNVRYDGWLPIVISPAPIMEITHRRSNPQLRDYQTQRRRAPCRRGCAAPRRLTRATRARRSRPAIRALCPLSARRASQASPPERTFGPPLLRPSTEWHRSGLPWLRGVGNTIHQKFR